MPRNGHIRYEWLRIVPRPRRNSRKQFWRAFSLCASSFSKSKAPSSTLLANIFQEYRTRLNLVSEKLIQLLIPQLAISKSASQAALKAFLATPLAFPKTKDTSTYLTKPENYARKSYEAISTLLNSSLSPSLWKEEKFDARLEAHNDDLRNALSSFVDYLSELKDLTPAFGHILHAVFTGHSLALHVLAFDSFLSKLPGKEVHPSQLTANKNTEPLARGLLEKTLQTIGTIKKGMDEGGLIDKVLDSVNGTDGDSVVGGLGELVDSGAMEVWAGDLVEGWRDAVVGLGLLKDVGKA